MGQAAIELQNHGLDLIKSSHWSFQAGLAVSFSEVRKLRLRLIELAQGKQLLSDRPKIGAQTLFPVLPPYRLGQAVFPRTPQWGFHTLAHQIPSTLPTFLPPPSSANSLKPTLNIFTVHLCNSA